LSADGSDRVTIDGCSIHRVDDNGIFVAEKASSGQQHTNLVIKNNTIWQTGLENPDGLRHGMYIQAADSIITGNVLFDSIGGNAISLRSSGVVRRNVVLGGSRKASFRYFNDHPAGPSKTLLVENNLFVERAPGADAAAPPVVEMMWASEAATPVDQAIFRFNTIVTTVADRWGLSISDEFAAQYVEAYGNLIVNSQKKSRTLNAANIDYLSRNLLTKQMHNFVAPNPPANDFDLVHQAPARGFATGETVFPASDIQFEPRPGIGGVLDAGADQYGPSSGLLFADGFETGKTSRWSGEL
jgi:hypothetical protein